MGNEWPTRGRAHLTCLCRGVVATHQLDEFYPLSPAHKNSFTHYVRSLYFPLLGLQDHNILDMDLYKAQVLTDEDLKGTRPHAMCYQMLSVS